MKRLLLCLIFGLSSAAAGNENGRYWPQSTHIRTLLFEGWSGSYIESTYVGDLGTVRFDFCRRESGSVYKKCERLHRPLVLIRNLEFYEPRLLAQLKKVRETQAAELDTSFISRLLGGSKADPNIEALDRLILEIEDESLAHWLLQTESPRNVPSVSTMKISTRVAEVFRQVFELKAPKPTPDIPEVLTGELVN